MQRDLEELPKGTAKASAPPDLRASPYPPVPIPYKSSISSSSRPLPKKELRRQRRTKSATNVCKKNIFCIVFIYKPFHLIYLLYILLLTHLVQYM
ncbi:hypothetical protein GDO78_003448 [Eleutherodactylus coqui]|uniref:Uncharacterized protein n=1 Tax=Eleutherodactylus coqui TaxID=57060 RepID=A0A8J6EU42_ELECQ|nr:hypothetical protein GDO78_003448 [Eleutherodactylus coqui]